MENAAEMDGRWIEVREPKKAKLALEMMADWKSYRAIAKETGLSNATLVRLKQRHLGDIEARREAAAQENEELADMYREILREKAEELLSSRKAMSKERVKDLALTAAIMTDKALNLRGEASSIVEHKSGVSLEDAQRALEEARRRIDAEVVDV